MMRVETVSYPTNFANTYFVIDEDRVVIIDPGSDGSSLLSRINRANWKPQAILLTHGHFDHVNGAEYLQKQLSLPVYVHHLDETMIGDPRLNGADSFGFDGRYDITLSTFGSDEALTFGNITFQALHTPFHTPGSVSYYVKEKGWLFSGDTLFKNSIGRSDLPLGSFRNIHSSLAKLQNLALETIVYPGHGPKTTIGTELSFNRYFKLR